MSDDFSGGINYGLVKRFFNKYDFVTFPYSGTQDFYPCGARAFLSNPAIFDLAKGWCIHDFEQAAAPLFFGFLPWPRSAPGFEAKHIRLQCTRTALVRFGDIRNVAVVIPPSPPFPPMAFWQKTFIIFVRSQATAGTMFCTFEG